MIRNSFSNAVRYIYTKCNLTIYKHSSTEPKQYDCERSWQLNEPFE